MLAHLLLCQGVVVLVVLGAVMGGYLPAFGQELVYIAIYLSA